MQRNDKRLLALFIDISGKRGTAYIFNDGQHSEVGKFFSKDYQEHIKEIERLINRHQVNYLVYERREIEQIPRRSSEDNGFIAMIKVIKGLVSYCHGHKIAGATIEPGEVRRFRESKNYCGRDPIKNNKYFCDYHKKEAPCDNGYPEREIPIEDEVAARSIYEIGAEKEGLNDEKGLRERERIHATPFNYIGVEDGGQNKGQRLKTDK